MNAVNVNTMTEDEIAKLKTLIASAEASHQQKQRDDNDLEALALAVTNAAIEVDAINDITYEQQRPIVICVRDISQAAHTLDRIKRSLLTEEALLRAGFDVEAASEMDQLILSAINARIAALERYKQVAIERGDLVTQHLSAVSNSYRGIAGALDHKIIVTQNLINSVSSSRKANLEALLDMGVPKDVAESSAKPTEKEADELKRELSELKSQRESCHRIVRSAQLQAEIAFPI